MLKAAVQLQLGVEVGQYGDQHIQLAVGLLSCARKRIITDRRTGERQTRTITPDNPTNAASTNTLLSHRPTNSEIDEMRSGTELMDIVMHIQ